MGFRITKTEETTRVDIEGQLIIGNRQELKQRVLEKLEEGDRDFVLNFRDARYVDNSGLGVLVSIQSKIQERGGKLRLVNPNEDLRTMLSLTYLERLFTIEVEPPK